MSEYIDLYDVNRQLTGETAERKSKQPADAYRLFVHVCIFDKDGRMLSQRRALTKKVRPGCWEFSAGGGVSAGETSQQAAQRETLEELGINIDFSVHRPVASINFAGGFDDFYTIEIDSEGLEFALQEDEVAEVKWVSLEDVCTLMDEGSFVPFGKELLQYLFVAREGKGLWSL